MNIATFSDVFTFLSPIALLIGVLIGVIQFNRLNNIYKNITIYLILMFCIDISTRLVGIYGSNFIILPLYTFSELCFFIYLYNKFFLNKYRRIITWLGIFGAIYIVVESVTFFILEDIDTRQFQPYAKVIDNFIVILMALAFLLESAHNFKNVDRKLFQLNMVVLIFFTVTIIVFLPFNFLINETSGLKHYFWVINTICLILFELYLAYCIWRNGKQNKLTRQRV